MKNDRDGSSTKPDKLLMGNYNLHFLPPLPPVRRLSDKSELMDLDENAFLADLGSHRNLLSEYIIPSLYLRLTFAEIFSKLFFCKFLSLLEEPRQ